MERELIIWRKKIIEHLRLWYTIHPDEKYISNKELSKTFRQTPKKCQE